LSAYLGWRPTGSVAAKQKAEVLTSEALGAERAEMRGQLSLAASSLTYRLSEPKILRRGCELLPIR
jgi:hypothetical protein